MRIPRPCQYTGYVTTNNNMRRLFYWFVESQGNPATDPVILWMTGTISARSRVECR